MGNARRLRRVHVKGTSRRKQGRLDLGRLLQPAAPAWAPKAPSPFHSWDDAAGEWRPPPWSANVG